MLFRSRNSVLFPSHDKEAEAAKKSADKEQRARDRAAKLAAKVDMGAPDSIKDLGVNANVNTNAKVGIN